MPSRYGMYGSPDQSPSPDVYTNKPKKKGWRDKIIERNESAENVQSKNINFTHFEPCGKTFERDLIHNDGSKDKLVCICGGEDGLCKTCAVQEANK